MKEKTKKRLAFFAAFALLFLTEVLIALFVHDRFVRPYLGDVIVVVLMYCFVRGVFPDGIPLLPLWLLLFSSLVEVLQYFHFVDLIGLGGNRLFRTLLGTSFSHIDLLCYLAGSVLCFLYEWIEKRISAGKRGE